MAGILRVGFCLEQREKMNAGRDVRNAKHPPPLSPHHPTFPYPTFPPHTPKWIIRIGKLFRFVVVPTAPASAKSPNALHSKHRKSVVSMPSRRRMMSLSGSGSPPSHVGHLLRPASLSRRPSAKWIRPSHSLQTLCATLRRAQWCRMANRSPHSTGTSPRRGSF
jgi:hypothetical protein